MKNQISSKIKFSFGLEEYEDGDLGMGPRGRSLKFFLRHSLESDAMELKNGGSGEKI